MEFGSWAILSIMGFDCRNSDKKGLIFNINIFYFLKFFEGLGGDCSFPIAIN